MGQQRVHHLCLKLKHAFNSRHARTFVKDTPTFRAIADILFKKGFLVNVMPGDDRGPFVDLVAAQDASNDALLSSGQHERLEVLKRMKNTLERVHTALGSDGTRAVALSDVPDSLNAFQDIYPCSVSALVMQHMGGFVPPVSSVSLPASALGQSKHRLTASELHHLTWPRDRRLWMDLRYNRHQEPALTDMGSRRIKATVAEIDKILSGRVYNPWKSSDVGAVTIVQTEDGEIVSAHEALKRNQGGEILCVAK